MSVFGTLSILLLTSLLLLLTSLSTGEQYAGKVCITSGDDLDCDNLGACSYAASPNCNHEGVVTCCADGSAIVVIHADGAGYGIQTCPSNGTCPEGTMPAESSPLNDADDDSNLSDYLLFSLGLALALFIIVAMGGYIWYLVQKEKAGKPVWQPLLGSDVDDGAAVSIKIDSVADDE